MTSRGRKRETMGSKLAVPLVTVTLALCLLAGCTSARNSLGTSDSSCYLALPSASHAVGPHSKFIGVHQFTLSSLRQKEPGLFDSLAALKPTSQRVCIIEFVGSFTQASVQKPLGKSSGRLAVVVLEAPSNHLLGTVIFHHPPLDFAHPHVG
jgi:hypothetical protein